MSFGVAYNGKYSKEPEGGDDKQRITLYGLMCLDA